MIYEKTHIYIISIFLLFLFSCSNGMNSSNIRISNWQILHSQTEDYSKANLSEEWELFSLNESIQLPYTRKGYHQFVWIKGDFYIDDSVDTVKGITFNYISPVHRIYINNLLIHETTTQEVRDLGGPRTYFIPPGILKIGKNKIHIRIGEYDKWNIEINKDIILNDSVSYIKNRSTSNIISETIPMSVLAMILISFFSFLLKGLLEKINREYLILSFRLLLILLCFLSFYSPIPLFSINVIVAIWSGVLPLFCLCLFYQPQVLYSIFFNRLNSVIISFLLISSILIFISKITNYLLAFSNILLFASILVSSILISYVIGKIIKNRRRDFKFILILVDTATVFINVITITIFLTFNIYILDPSILVIISCVILATLYSIYFANRESLRKESVVSLSIKLEELMNKSSNSKKYNISPQLADKLDQIILFIENNHSQYVTRDLLAETAGLSPNYLSSLFNVYTGKKINEYINSIRLEDAAKKLINSDFSITDIAFSSGFESLTTFNRLFKKMYESSPKEFRQKVTNSSKRGND